MGVTLEKVTYANFWEICELKVAEPQKDFVAANLMSLAGAYVCVTTGGTAQPFGVYAGKRLVGFVMIGYGTNDEMDLPVAVDNYCLWRLMIDERYQGKGYGRAAVQAALDWMRTDPLGKANYCWLSFEPENEVARTLYASFGFQETNQRCGNELIAVLPL